MLTRWMDGGNHHGFFERVENLESLLSVPCRITGLAFRVLVN